MTFIFFLFFLQLISCSQTTSEIFSPSQDEFPQMPESEPEALLQMQDQISSSIGLTFPKNQTQKNEAKDSNLFPFSIPRFMQLENPGLTSLAQAEPLTNAFEIAQFTDVWASSVFNNEQIFEGVPGKKGMNFPAINAILGFSYWCSSGQHSEDQVIKNCFFFE